MTTYQDTSAEMTEPVEPTDVTAADASLEAPPVGDWQDLVNSVEEAPANSTDPVIRLVQEYKEAIKARDEWEDKYLRAAAEFANARRRAEMRADNQIWAARERILAAILPVVDDFQRAFNAVPADEQQSPWVEGFALIQRKLKSVLEREGVSEIPALGQHFDPTRHQAVISEPTPDVEPGTVLEVLQPGYLLEDRVLRPSMVKVAQ